MIALISVLHRSRCWRVPSARCSDAAEGCVLLNLLSVAAAWGALIVLVFQRRGVGSDPAIWGIEASPGRSTSSWPVVTFALRLAFGIRRWRLPRRSLHRAACGQAY